MGRGVECQQRLAGIHRRKRWTAAGVGHTARGCHVVDGLTSTAAPCLVPMDGRWGGGGAGAGLLSSSAGGCILVGVFSLPLSLSHSLLSPFVDEGGEGCQVQDPRAGGGGG